MMISVRNPNLVVRRLPVIAAAVVGAAILLALGLTDENHYTEEEREWCREQYPNLSFDECSKHFTY
jgi:hypothetical protein